MFSKGKGASKSEAIMYTKKIGCGCWPNTIRGGDLKGEGWQTLLGKPSVFNICYNAMADGGKETTCHRGDSSSGTPTSCNCHALVVGEKRRTK